MSGELTVKSQYQVGVRVLECKHLTWLNMDPLVCVEINGDRHCTRVVESTDNPYYNEFFLFSYHATLSDVMDKAITVSVYADRGLLRKQKLLANAKLDIGTVWRQPDHQVFHKWLALEDPLDPSLGNRGFVRLDVNVDTAGHYAPPPRAEPEDDDIEGNLLPCCSENRERARYEFTVYRGDHVLRPTSASKGQSSRDPPSTCVTVSFATLTARTNVCKNTYDPEWNERLVFSEYIPALWQRARLQLLNGNVIISTIYFDLSKMSNPGSSGFLPTFGPSHVFLYGPDASYRGRLLVSVRTVVGGSVDFGGTTVEPAAPIREEDYWRTEEVTMFGVVLAAGCLPRSLAGSQVTVEVAMGNTAGEVSLESIATDQEATGSTGPLLAVLPTDAPYCSLRIPDDKPCIAVQRMWPHTKRRLAFVNLLGKLVEQLESGMRDLENNMKGAPAAMSEGSADTSQMLKDLGCKATTSIEKAIQLLIAKPPNYTRLDVHYTAIRKSKLVKLGEETACWVNGVDSTHVADALKRGRALVAELKIYLDDPQQSLPDPVLMLCSANSMVLGYCHLNVRDLIYSSTPEKMGRKCGVISTVQLKGGEGETSDLIGALTMFLWVSSSRKAYRSLLQMLPPGLSPPPQPDPERLFLPIKMHCLYQRPVAALVHISGGRLRGGLDTTGLCDPFVRVTIADQTLETEVVPAQLNPQWNQTLVFNNISVGCSSFEYFKNYPLSIIIEVFDLDRQLFGYHRDKLVGRALMEPQGVRLFGQTHLTPPQQWLPITWGTQHVGDLLIGGELVLQSGSRDDVVGGGEWQPGVTTLPIPQEIRPHNVKYRLEVMFWGARDLKRVQLQRVSRPRVTMEISGHQLKSETILDASACSNFPNALRSITLDLPEQEYYLPPMVIWMHDCRSFGREVLVGSHMVPSLQPYFTKSVLFAAQNNKNYKFSIRQISGSYGSLSESTGLNSNFEPHPGTVVTNVNQPEPGTATESEDGGGKGAPASRKTIFINIDDGDRKKSSDKRVAGRSIIHVLEKETLNQLSGARRHHDHEKECGYDWWNKYYYSLKMDDGKEKSGETEGESSKTPATLTIYNCELEKVEEFNGLEDWLHSFELHRGTRTLSGKIAVVGILKCAMCLYRLPEPEPEALMLSAYPSNNPVRVCVRVYCVRATRLHPKDPSGLSDPYVLVQAGSQTAGSRDDCIRCQLEPIFGRMFQLEVCLPLDSQLVVRVWDYDVASRDDLIGETTIDLERRLYSCHRASCGLASRYNRNGYNAWRDMMPPSKVLLALCLKNRLGPPVYHDHYTLRVGDDVFTVADPNSKGDVYEQLASTALHTLNMSARVNVGRQSTYAVLPVGDADAVKACKLLDKQCIKESLPAPEYSTEATLTVGGTTFKLTGHRNLHDAREQVSLMALRRWREVTSAGLALVPEHVEVRPLMHPAMEGVPQGFLHMWVDVFLLPSASSKPPPPVNIAPRSALELYLRIVIWGCKEVILEESDFFTGEKSSDIYVKGWIPLTEPQETDVHYRSLDGDGAFNWRFVFPMRYLVGESTLEVDHEEGLLVRRSVKRTAPPRLNLQVWDSDHFSENDFLGSLVMDLTQMPQGSPTADACSLEMLTETAPTLNLFKVHRAHGWWPFRATDGEDYFLAGKVNMDLEIVTAEEALLNPAGQGRGPPGVLPPPIRPETSFNMLLNPLKTCYHFIYKRHRGTLVKLSLLAVFLMLSFTALLSFPNYSVKRLLGA